MQSNRVNLTRLLHMHTPQVFKSVIPIFLETYGRRGLQPWSRNGPRWGREQITELFFSSSNRTGLERLINSKIYHKRSYHTVGMRNSEA